MCVRSNCDIRSLTREQKVVSFIKVEKRLKDLEWNTKKYLCQRPVTSFARGRGQLQMLIALGAAGGAAVDLHNLAHLGHVHKLIDKSLTVNLGEDTALVVVPAINNRGG